jgi:predicted phage tail protein
VTLGDWSGTWSFVTIIEAPEAPLLLSPENGAIDVATDIDLAWNAAERASTYRVQVSTNLDFTNIIHEGIDVSDTSETVSGLEHETQYYWRVRAENIGGISNWSSVWSFTTVSTIPPAPTLSSPADSVTDQPTTITLSWNSTLMADYYQLQIATVPDFSSTFADVTNIFDTQHQVNGLDNDRTYYWRVRGINEIGAGDWSEVWNFSTGIAAPPAPVLVSPDDASVNQPVMITLDWEDTPRADIYRIQLSTVPNFSSTVINVGNINILILRSIGFGFLHHILLAGKRVE